MKQTPDGLMYTLFRSMYIVGVLNVL